MINIDVTRYPTSGTAGLFFNLPAGSAIELGQMVPNDASGTKSRSVRRGSESQSFGAAPQTIHKSVDEVELVTISPSAFLKSMWTLFITCFTEPFSETVIDVTTGEKVEQQAT